MIGRYGLSSVVIGADLANVPRKGVHAYVHWAQQERKGHLLYERRDKVYQRVV